MLVVKNRGENERTQPCSEARTSIGYSGLEEPDLQLRTIALSIVAVLSLIFFLRYAQELFLPVVISLLIVYALNPFVVLLERCRLHRTVASALVVLIMFSGLGATAYSMRQQLSAVLDTVPSAIAKLRQEVEKYQRSSASAATPIGKIQQAAKEIEKTAEAATERNPSEKPVRVQVQQPELPFSDFIRIGSIGLVGIISDAVVIFFLVFFLLASGDLFKRKLVEIMGTRLSEKKVTVATLNEINAQIEKFLWIQFVTSLAVAGLMSLGLWMFGMTHPVFWGIAAGVVCSIPYVGPIFVGIAIMIAAFVQFDSIGAAVEVALIPLVIFSLEGFLVKPAIMGKAARVNAASMFLALIFWSWTWGLIGTVVAVPIMMVIKTICDRVEVLHPIGMLLDEN